jgi:hypothetical protein
MKKNYWQIYCLKIVIFVTLKIKDFKIQINTQINTVEDIWKN